jgi:FkbM family methyltransferase
VSTPRVIEVDHRSRRISGATAGERCGIAMMQAASWARQRFEVRGLGWAVRVVAGVLPSSAVVQVRLEDDCIFEMPYGDRYWSLLLLRSARYEADMRGVIEAVAAVDYAFIDCGANFGYWSVLVSGRRLGGHPAVAVEAAPDTYQRLRRNAAVNGDRFVTLNRAIGERSGLNVPLYGAKHEARSVVAEGDAVPVAEVETLALDDLLGRPELSAGRPIMLKLDVEGAEVAAMAGAPRLLERDLVVVYEDHGADRSHAASTHFSRSLGMRLFAIDRNRGIEIGALEELSAIKRHRWLGYNFFATRSPLWIGHLTALCGPGGARAGVPAPPVRMEG